MKTVIEEILIDGLDDWITESWVHGTVAERTGLSGDMLRSASLGVIVEIMERGLMVPGLLKDGKHVPWRISTADAIERISKEWLSRDPDDVSVFYAIVWMENTEIGDQLARAAFARGE